MEEKFMSEAIKLAKECTKSGDIPVGCVIVKDNEIVGQGYNAKEKLNSPTCHAEVMAINDACKNLGVNNLSGLDMYVTFEPCLMCMGAIIGARISNLYFGAYDKRFPTTNVISEFPTNHTVNIVGGIDESECSNLLSKFFKELRCYK